MKALESFLAALIVAASAAGQTAHPDKKPAPKAKTTGSVFSCPDPDAKQACNSYAELLKAKDSSIPASGYVCFQKNEDTFFVLTFDAPAFHITWDERLKQQVINRLLKLPLCDPGSCIMGFVLNALRSLRGQLHVSDGFHHTKERKLRCGVPFPGSVIGR